MATSEKGDTDSIWREFQDRVNMTPKELEDWLSRDESKEAGQHEGDSESTGHASGRHILKILRSKRDQMSDDDYAHMRKVNGYIKRHLAQRPSSNIEDSKWRYSLMNWGHDPMK